MKYSEFKREVEKLGFVVIDSGAPIYVDKDKAGETLMSIDVHRRFRLDPDWRGFNKLTEDQQLKVYDLAYQLAKTPLVEREEEKRYWLQKIPVPLLDKEGEKKWLWKYTGAALSNAFGADTIKVDSKSYQTIFTESEIAEMDIAGFEKVEVKDE